MDYAPADPTPSPVPDSSSPPDEVFDQNYTHSVDDLLKDIPKSPPLPEWNDPELRYMPTGSDEGQPPVTTDEAWRKIYNLVEKWDKGMCESYREQIDTLLVFAGLFSAVVTAFAVESYQWLQDDPADASADLLRQAVVLLSTLANQTSPSLPSQRVPALLDSVVVRINVYWFLSLVLSLSAALIGILCKQWLREYERDIIQSAQQALAVRQMKFEGLEEWRVGAITTSVPLILQLSLALFLVGISELLWHLHRTVAIAVTTVAGLTGAFYLITASAPLWQYLYLSISSRMQMTGMYGWNTLPSPTFTAPQCPYKSPQAWLVLRLFQPIIDWAVFHRYYQEFHDEAESWISFDAYWTARRDEAAVETTISRALSWTGNTLGGKHLNAWRVLCARQHLAHDQAWGSMHSRAQRTDAKRKLLRSLLESVDDARTRKHVLLFFYSCHHDLDVSTSVELLLQLVADASFDAKWFSTGLHHIRDIFEWGRPILNDDLAIELVRVVHERLSYLNPGDQSLESASSMLKEAVCILYWAPSRRLFLPALSAVAVRFLQSSTAATPRERARAASVILWSLYSCTLRDRIVHQLQGFGHIVALAEFMLDNDPTLIHDGNSYMREALIGLGLSRLHEDRLLLRVQHRPDVDEDGLLSGTVSEQAEAHLTPDFWLPPSRFSRSTGFSTVTNSALVDDTRLPETEIATHTGAPYIRSLSGESRLASDLRARVELHDMPARAGDTDDDARTDPRPGFEQPNSPGGSSRVTNTSGPPAPHIVIPIEPLEMGASTSGPTSTSHDSEAP